MAAENLAGNVNLAGAFIDLIQGKILFQGCRGCDHLKGGADAVWQKSAVNQRGIFAVRHGLGQIIRPVGREACHGFYFPRVRVHDHNRPFFKAFAAGILHDFLDVGVNGQHHPRLYRRSLSDLRGKAGNPTAQAVQLVDRLGFLFKGSQVFVIAFFNAGDAVAGVVQITDDVRGQLGGICPDRDGIFPHPRGV